MEVNGKSHALKSVFLAGTDNKMSCCAEHYQRQIFTPQARTCAGKSTLVECVLFQCTSFLVSENGLF